MSDQNSIMLESRLTTGARCLYGILKTYNKTIVSVSQSQLASDMGRTDRIVRECLDELECSGIIRTVRTGLGQPNTYLLYDIFDVAGWQEWYGRKQGKAESKKR